MRQWVAYDQYKRYGAYSLQAFRLLSIKFKNLYTVETLLLTNSFCFQATVNEVVDIHCQTITSWRYFTNKSCITQLTGLKWSYKVANGVILSILANDSIRFSDTSGNFRNVSSPFCVCIWKLPFPASTLRQW